MYYSDESLKGLKAEYQTIDEKLNHELFRRIERNCLHAKSCPMRQSTFRASCSTSSEASITSRGSGCARPDRSGPTARRFRISTSVLVQAMISSARLFQTNSD